MQHDVAGDPITNLKWTRKTEGKIATELSKLNIEISGTTVRRLLKTLGIRLRVNKKAIACGATYDAERRDKQFNRISVLRNQFSDEGNPIISVDTKKKELIGKFKNHGVKLCKYPDHVNDHDYTSYAKGKINPYGIYDTANNIGMVCIGTSKDTPAFAVDSVEKWWKKKGSKKYKEKTHLLILADSGGSNGASSRVWKYRLQKQLCNKYALTITVCHYPPGTSKWNPIEHRLFSEISKNWAGEPLDSIEKAIKFIKTTKTKTGLSVCAYLNKKIYNTGEKVNNAEFGSISIRKDEEEPRLIYTIAPN